MNRENVQLRLELIAAKAKQLAADVKNGKLWPGDLSAGLHDIHEQLAHVGQEARNDR